jgi:non-canonical purine NTP pyrophosphatase (RdgB/HAM1 family)
MKEILFATSNSRKIEEANESLKAFDIVVNAIKIDIDEIQHQDSSEITKAKVRAAYEVTHRPVVVSDTSWEIPALGGFPGGYMKDVSEWFDAKDWLSLMSRHEDKTIYCHEHIAYFDGEELQQFVSTYEGTFIDKPRGRVDAGESIEQVVVLYGDLTMAEYLARGSIASAGEVLSHWKQFGEWYDANSHASA